jgi:hypothetical protein
VIDIENVFFLFCIVARAPSSPPLENVALLENNVLFGKKSMKFYKQKKFSLLLR